MIRKNLCKQSAKDVTKVIRFPGKWARYRRAITRKTGLPTDAHGLRQALCEVKERVLRRRRSSSRRVLEDGPGTLARGNRIRRLAA